MRQQKAKTIWDALNEDSATTREHTKETLHALRDLIEECDNAIRSHPDMLPHMIVPEQSIFLGRLYATYFDATKDRI
jgi:hypothetical protein